MIHRVAAAVSGVLATAALTPLVASYPLTAFGVAIVPTRSLWVYAVAERGQLRLLLLEPVASLTRTMPRERAWYIDSNEFYCYTHTAGTGKPFPTFRWETQNHSLDCLVILGPRSGQPVICDVASRVPAPVWHETRLGLPLWALVPVFSVYPMITLVRRTRARHRRMQGRCAACGYDLTGNVSGVCPECGRTAPAPDLA